MVSLKIGKHMLMWVSSAAACMEPMGSIRSVMHKTDLTLCEQLINYKLVHISLCSYTFHHILCLPSNWFYPVYHACMTTCLSPNAYFIRKCERAASACQMTLENNQVEKIKSYPHFLWAKAQAFFPVPEKKKKKKTSWAFSMLNSQWEQPLALLTTRKQISQVSGC